MRWLRAIQRNCRGECGRAGRSLLGGCSLELQPKLSNFLIDEVRLLLRREISVRERVDIVAQLL